MVEITSSHDTLWVNGPTHMLGRFAHKLGSVAFEIYQPTTKGGHVGMCFAPMLNLPAAWEEFRSLMCEHHGIKIPDDKRPAWVV